MRVLLCWLAFCATMLAATFQERFVIVFIDADTEAKLGAFPLDRSLIAKAVQQAAISRARGVVLKFFLCLELATKETAVIVPGQKMTFGRLNLRLDRLNCLEAALPVKDELTYIPFHRFVAGEVPTEQIRDNVVIIGYDGAKMHSLPSAIGQMKAHRLFIYGLMSAYGQLSTE